MRWMRRLLTHLYHHRHHFFLDPTPDSDAMCREVDGGIEADFSSAWHDETKGLVPMLATMESNQPGIYSPRFEPRADFIWFGERERERQESAQEVSSWRDRFWALFWNQLRPIAMWRSRTSSQLTITSNTRQKTPQLKLDLEHRKTWENFSPFHLGDSYQPVLTVLFKAVYHVWHGGWILFMLFHQPVHSVPTLCLHQITIRWVDLKVFSLFCWKVFKT